MDEDGESLLKRLENDWNVVVTETNAYCENHEVTSHELRAIYEDHIDAFRGWSAAEAKKHGVESAEALAAIRLQVVTILIWKLWMDYQDNDMRRPLRDELWARCEARVNMKAMEIADRTWTESNRLERIEELKHEFGAYFEKSIAKYKPGRSRFTTFIDRCARNRLVNIIERDESANRIKFRALPRDVQSNSYSVEEDQKEKLQWIHHTTESLVQGGHLKEKDVAAFRARTIDETKVVDVAVQLGMAIGTVDKAVKRVTKALRSAAELMDQTGDSNV
ncbi:hypothetical protein [Novipirellula rosea]|uniref:RNA polymerase sigma factor n=1 Tax=Novipirellula rosea TaxID=1031540 RepID=A0ABP8NI28_9BACT